MLLPKTYYQKTLHIAFPLMLSLAGQTLVQMADSIMVGQLGAVELAAVSFAGVILVDLIVLGIGIALSLTPMVGHSFAVGGYKEAGILFQNSFILNTAIGLALVLIVGGIYPLLNVLGQPPEVVAMAKDYYWIAGVSLFPYMIFLSFKQFMEGIGQTSVSMQITLGATGLNILLNYVFIFGKWGCPPLGVAGAAWATLCSRLLMPIAFYFYMRRAYPYRRFFLFFRWQFLSVKKQWHLLRVGFPISIQIFAECFALSVLAIMMGWISTEALAANQIVHAVFTFTYMIANGIAGAVTVLVSHSFGRKNARDIITYTRAGWHLSSAIMLVAGLCFMLFGRYIGMAFSSDPAVLDITAKIFFIAAFMELFDGWQITSLGALRGIVDVKRPMLYSMGIYGFICIPVGYFLGFVLDFGTSGVFFGLVVSLVVASVLFSGRFYRSSKKWKNKWTGSNPLHVV